MEEKYITPSSNENTSDFSKNMDETILYCKGKTQKTFNPSKQENKPITIIEAINLKEYMEAKIFRIVNDFQAETMIDVESIYINHLYAEGQEKPYVSTIKIKITL